MITVNGNKMTWFKGITIEHILNNLGNKFPIIVVKVNGRYIPKKEHNTFEIPDNAEVNTVDIIAGG